MTVSEKQTVRHRKLLEYSVYFLTTFICGILNFTYKLRLKWLTVNPIP